MWAVPARRAAAGRRPTARARVDASAEIVRLCEGYSIVSEYASFIVLENDAEYQRWKIERRNAMRIERDERALAERCASGSRRCGAQPRSRSDRSIPTLSRRPLRRRQRPRRRRPSRPPRSRRRPPRAGGASTCQRLAASGGGGAIDPVTGVLLLAAGSAGLRSLRRRQ